MGLGFRGLGGLGLGGWGVLICKGLNNEQRVWGVPFYNDSRIYPKPYSNYSDIGFRCSG